MSDAQPTGRTIRLAIGAAWIVFQVFIIFYPQPPLVERPLHLCFATVLLFLYQPSRKLGAFDAIFPLSSVALAVHYLTASARLTERMEGIDPVLTVDAVFGVISLILLFEGVRRVVGWSLWSVLALFLAYGFLGGWLPGWLHFSGFEFYEAIEIISMSLNGILGITTETSAQFVFYFILFGAVYSAVGGGQLFIDLGLRLSGRAHGGAAKAAVVSSSIMGSISGSAVANVASTGVFTIPLMKRAGYSAERAAAVEAIASTGGQLMPPIMGVAAFVMAEMLQVDYTRVALAGLIPALAFYLALFLLVDLRARQSGMGTLTDPENSLGAAILPRLYLLVPPIALVAMLVLGYSASYAALIGCATSIAVSFVRRETALTWSGFADLIEEGARQAAVVAVPIAAIGIIIAVAIQSNLALKFSAGLIEGSGGTLIGAMGLIIIGCIVMGMGLPTVAAYIIGAILFAPALLKLGIPELAAHFFVMYYCVLSMVTPPVALASYAAAGLADADTMRTSFYAFRMSAVCFLIPFAFAFDPRLLGEGAPLWIVAATLSLFAGTAAWAVALVGYWRRQLGVIERLAFAGASIAVICFPTGTTAWFWALGALAAAALWSLIAQPRLSAAAAHSKESQA